MHRLALLIVLCLALPGCATAWVSPVQATLHAPAGEPAVLPGGIEDGWAIVEATVNGQGPFRFILDTGANFSVITTAAAAQAGVEPTDKAKIVDIGGDRRTYPLGWADDVEVGPMSLRRMPFIVTDNISALMETIDAVGLLGYPGFDQLTLDLDYPSGVVRVSDAPIDPGSPGTVRLRRLNHETPEITVTLLGADDQPIDERWFAVDSGGHAGLHAPSGMTGWVHVDLAAATRPGIGLSGIEYDNPLAPLTGPIRIGGTVVERAVGDLDTYHTLIGHQLLRLFRVRLDPRSGLAQFILPDPARTRITALQYAGIGVQLRQRDDDGLVILRIAADSPAARAGLLPNDRVVAIDGVPFDAPGFVDHTRWAFNPPPELTLTVRRDETVFDLTVATEPLFPEDLARLRNAAPDLEPPPIRLITNPDGSQDLVFPDGTRGPFEVVAPTPQN